MNRAARVRALVVAACVVLFGLGGYAQSADDRVWQDFLKWLESAPAADGPGIVLQQYQKNLVAKGASQADAERQTGIVIRLMRERSDAWRLLFNKVYASPTPGFSTRPNALLVAAVEGRTPGRAVDVGMGQGRNAVFLASKGWDVTGFDVSEEGLAVAKANAARARVTINAVHESDAQFDFGTAQWDLIVITYGPVSITDDAYVARLIKGLRPSGLIVIESFASDRTAVRRKPVDIDPADLLRAFASFRIVRFEDTDAVPDWDAQKTRLVRLVAQKK